MPAEPAPGRILGTGSAGQGRAPWRRHTSPELVAFQGVATVTEDGPMDRESQHDRVPSKEELVRIFEIWNAAHSLHTHSYLEALFNERMNDLGKVKRFAEVLFRFCEKFHDCLFALGLNARADDAIRASIVDN